MCYLIASSCSCSENHAQYTSEEPTVFAPAHSNLFSLSFLHTVTIPPGRREEPLVYFNINPSGWRYRGIPFCHFSQVLYSIITMCHHITSVNQFLPKDFRELFAVSISFVRICIWVLGDASQKPPVLSMHYFKTVFRMRGEGEGGDTQQRATSHVGSEFIMIFGVFLSPFLCYKAFLCIKTPVELHSQNPCQRDALPQKTFPNRLKWLVWSPNFTSVTDSFVSRRHLQLGDNPPPCCLPLCHEDVEKHKQRC